MICVTSTEELLAQISAQVQKGELPNVADVCSWSRVSEETGSQLTVTTQQERVEVPLHFVSPLKKGGKQKRKMSTSVSKNADSGIAVKSGAAVDEGEIGNHCMQ